MTTSEQNWWTEKAGYFGPEYFRQYDGTIITEEKTLREVDFVINTVCGGRTDLRFLDVPCGHGRHTLELGRRDCRTTGYELNSFFLDKARQAAWDAGFWRPERPDTQNLLNFIQGDMRELPFKEEFHVVLNMFTAMGYFGDDCEDERFFAGAYQALITGGKFVVDYLNRDRLIRNFQSNDWRVLPDGSTVLVERTYDITKGQMHDVKLTYKDGQEVSRATSTVRFYAPHELIAMAERVGFTLNHVYGDFDGRPLTIHSPRCILVFNKPR